MDLLRGMQAFVAVVDRGSLSAAAEQLKASAVMVGKFLQPRWWRVIWPRIRR